ncbi:MAG: 30S ribosomal protein S6 [Clostridia bacterium]|nr:30S ribosomal protein S6 [Clostridia bacterium]
MNTYETLFIVDPTIGEDAAKAAIEKFTALIADIGTISEINEWGKRRLAYPINDINEGYYVVVTFKSAPEFPAELERLFNINDAIMRSIVVKLDEKVLAKAAAAAAAREAAAAAAEAAAAEAADAAQTPEA